MSDNIKRPMRKWTKEEDDLLRQAIAKHPADANGRYNWAIISRYVPNREPCRCSERWCNILDPKVKRSPWTSEEDAFIRQAYDDLGPKWADIARLLDNGRSGDNLRHHARTLLQLKTKHLKFDTEKLQLGTKKNKKRKISAKSDIQLFPATRDARSPLPPPYEIKLPYYVNKDSGITSACSSLGASTFSTEEHDSTLRVAWREQARRRRNGEWKPTGRWKPPSWASVVQSNNTNTSRALFLDTDCVVASRTRSNINSASCTIVHESATLLVREQQVKIKTNDVGSDVQDPLNPPVSLDNQPLATCPPRPTPAPRFDAVRYVVYLLDKYMPEIRIGRGVQAAEQTHETSCAIHNSKSPTTEKKSSKSRLKVELSSDTCIDNNDSDSSTELHDNHICKASESMSPSSGSACAKPKISNLADVRYPQFVTPSDELLIRAHTAMHALLPEGDCENLDVVRLAVSYYDYWRPKRGETRVILLAESHAFTEKDRALHGPGLDPRFLAHSYSGPRDFVSLVYCLAYGEEQSLMDFDLPAPISPDATVSDSNGSVTNAGSVASDQSLDHAALPITPKKKQSTVRQAIKLAGGGTSQFWSLFAACSRGTSKPAAVNPSKDVSEMKFAFAADVLKKGGLSVDQRLEAKHEVLCDLQKRGIWLMDASVFGWYISQPQRYSRSKATNEVHRLAKERPPKVLKTPALVLAWEMYTKHVIRQVAEEGSLQIVVPIGMEVEKSLTRHRLEEAVRVNHGSENGSGTRVVELFQPPTLGFPVDTVPSLPSCLKLLRRRHHLCPS